MGFERFTDAAAFDYATRTGLYLVVFRRCNNIVSKRNALFPEMMYDLMFFCNPLAPQINLGTQLRRLMFNGTARGKLHPLMCPMISAMRLLS